MGVNLLMNRRRMAVSQPHLSVATGTAAMFQTAIQAPLVSCALAFDTAKTGLTIRHTGKNVLDCTSVTNSQWNMGGIPNTLLPNTTYTFSVQGDTVHKYRMYLSNNGTSGQFALHSGSLASGGEISFTTPSNTLSYPYIVLVGYTDGAGNDSIANIKPQVEFGSAATVYESYAGNKYTVSWTNSVAGTLNAVTGLLTVNGGGSVQLTPISMTAKKGINIIWADTGTATVRYYTY